MRTIHQLAVEEMMKRIGQELPLTPSIPSLDCRKLRAKMLLEETLEQISGLGFNVRLAAGYSWLDIENVEFSEKGPCDILEVVDGCADVAVINTGTLSSFGVGEAPVLSEVDMNNLAKFGPGSYRREDGKWMKPPGHPKPDFLKILLEQGYKP